MEEKIKEEEFYIYSDGSGVQLKDLYSYAYVIVKDGKVLCYDTKSFDDDLLSNNKMELRGIIEGLECFYREILNIKISKNKVSEDPVYLMDKDVNIEELSKKYFVRIYSDSSYCIMGLKSWLVSWKKRNWTKVSTNTPILNKQLWKKMDFLYSRLANKKAKWVRAHVKNFSSQHEVFNDLCDRILQLHRKNKYSDENVQKLIKEAEDTFQKMVGT